MMFYNVLVLHAEENIVDSWDSSLCVSYVLIGPTPEERTEQSASGNVTFSKACGMLTF